MSEEAKTRKTRDTGKLMWLVVEGESLSCIALQPHFDDIAAARKWLTERVTAGDLSADQTYALHRAIVAVKPRVETVRKVVL